MYLLNLSSGVSFTREALPQPPNIFSILVAMLGRVENLEKTGLGAGDLRGVAGAGPRTATGNDREVPADVCFLQYSVICDESSFEFVNYQEILTMDTILVRAKLI